MFEFMPICEYCNQTHDGSYGSGRFCSKKCAKSYSSHKNLPNLKKKSKCCVCGKEIEIGKNGSTRGPHKCEECKKKKKCVICGKFGCTDEFCKKHNHQQFKTFIKYFGFDQTAFGTERVKDEFYRVKDELYNLYWIEHLSSQQIGKRYNYKSFCNLAGKVFKYLEIPSKTPRYSVKENLLYDRLNPSSNTKYHDGWHTTWNNKEVYLRSSFEFEFAKELDGQKIEYEVEFKHIKYFDTQLNEYRCAIPDFYIPSTNTIVEIKSTWTLNKQEMIDKFKAYRELGYNCKLICDHKEMLL